MSIAVAALTKGVAVPSRRYRLAQYVRPLADYGVDVTELVPRVASDRMPRAFAGTPARRALGHLLLAAPRVGRRVPHVIAARRHDVVILQRELVPALETIERLAGHPRVFDVDDAIWSRSPRVERRIARIVRGCDEVWCGNDYIADWVASVDGTPVVVPTVVDASRFGVRESYEDGHRLGWLGSSSNLPYLAALLPVLDRLASRRSMELIVVADRIDAEFRSRPYVKFLSWRDSFEYEMCFMFDIGLMPLGSGTWAEGKCGMKALQYMAAGLPAVASVTRMTSGLGGGLALAADASTWEHELDSLMSSEERRRHLGSSGRQLVERDYSLAIWAPQLAERLTALARRYKVESGRGESSVVLGG
jgi:glycosyltransferase involved in cell wall biosynthesis